MTEPHQPFGRMTYAGIFFLTLGTIMFEILLTRIFSVTMWYHFAFMAISVALFGMTIGAITVFIRPKTFTAEKGPQHLAICSLLYAVSVTICFLIYLYIPYGGGRETMDVLTLPLIFVTVSIPFIFSGIAVTIALTKFPRYVSRIYGVDLAGAAFGCLLVIGLLELSDGPTAIIYVTAISALAAYCFAHGVPGKFCGWMRRGSLGLSAVVFAFCIINSIAAQNQQGMIGLRWVKGELEVRYPDAFDYERWNSFSRIRVVGTPGQTGDPWGWALSEKLPPHPTGMEQYLLNIDATAATAVTKWDGEDLEIIDYLKWDLTNLVHHMRDDADVLVVGVGGGRDILSAMTFGQNYVRGIELNPTTIDIVTNPAILGDVTSLSKHRTDPRYDIVVDEARSYIARHDDQYDILMVSLIDTWAATAAGAFVMSENSLYTMEAWRLFVDRLKPGGIFSTSRWYHHPTPLEMYRMLAMATQVKEERGVVNIRDHVVIMRRMIYDGAGVGTFLLSRDPFTEEDLAIVDMAVEKFGFERVLTPDYAINSTFEEITNPSTRDAFIRYYPVNIAPPTDNSPFFFNMLRLGDFFRHDIIADQSGEMVRLDDLYMSEVLIQGVRVLGRLLITVIVLGALCIFLPLILATRRGIMKGSFPYITYFFGIGIGFMMVEIAEMQRLIVFLGHPIYALTVVLFVFLLFSGIGSYFTDSLGANNLARGGTIRLGVLIGVLIATSIATPLLVSAFAGSVTIVRIGLAVAMLAPMAFFMGMAFPIGMKAANIAHEGLSPWLWGINGAMSVVATVLAVAVSMTTTITHTFAIGTGAYVITLVSFLYMANKNFR